MYSHHLVWPIISLEKTTASAYFPELYSQTGETLLDAIDENFKADGQVELNGIKFCLLETFGAYGIKDNNRFSEDHVKGAFGALIFLRNILKTFATEDILQELAGIFVHARGKYIHLWPLKMLTKDVQVLEHLIHTKVPKSSSSVEEMLDLGNFCVETYQVPDDS